MAKQNIVNVGIKFTADAKEAQQALKDLNNEIVKLGSQRYSVTDTLDTKAISTLGTDLAKIGTAMNEAFDTSTSQLNISKMLASLKSMGLT